MSLTRQLGIGFTFVLMLVFLGTVWININSTRHYINDQLASHAQDTATSLGLSISPYLGNKSDLHIIDTMLNAIFDRGYYQSIVLKSMDGTVILEKRNPPKPDAVPDWFTHWFALSPPVAETEINTGWTLGGVLTVTSHPGLGYAQLWDAAKQTFWLTLGLFVIGIILLAALLRVITVPVKAVMRAAERISQRRFIPIAEVPKTKELNLMVRAINKMAGILNAQHKELTAQAETYYQTAYVDPLTQLGNKLALDNELARLFSDPEEAPTGVLVLIRLSSLSYVNEVHGAQAADSYIRLVAGIVTEHARALSARVFRPRGADFAVLIRALPEATCDAWISNLADALRAHSQPSYNHGCAHIGGAYYSADMNSLSLIEHADAALTAARSTPQKWLMASSIALRQSHQKWRDELARVIRTNAVDIVLQPIKSMDGKLQMTECLARCKADSGDTYLPMAQLMAEAEKLQMAGKLDKLILDEILRLVLQDTTPSSTLSLAINLSTLSIADNSILDEILITLNKIRKLTSSIAVEIHEESLQRCSENCLYLATRLQAIDCKLTVERVGSSLGAFTHLREIRPDFIKIDGSITRHIDTSQDNQFFVRSLVTIAHGLDIAVITELVEDESEAHCLQELFVDYMQGYFVGKPRQWG